MPCYDGFRPKDMNILLIFHHDRLLQNISVQYIKLFGIGIIV